MKENKPSTFKRSIRSFVRREGRMTTAQKRAMETLWPVYGLEVGDAPLALEKVFGREAPVIVEIGFGMGDALLEMAQAQPEKNFIGIEVHRPGVGALLSRLDKNEINNVKVFCEDATTVFASCIPAESLDRIYILFPDPWHKKKHHKRRLIQTPFVALLHEKLKPGGVLHLATDWEDYAEHMQAVVGEYTGFINQAGHAHYAKHVSDRPKTKFEARGKRLGHGVWDLIFIKATT